ncbi:MAG: ATP-binding protein [Polyangiaceae bacterium]
MNAANRESSDIITEVPTSEVRLAEHVTSLQSEVDLVVSDVPPIATADALHWADRLLESTLDATLDEGRITAIKPCCVVWQICSSLARSQCCSSIHHPRCWYTPPALRSRSMRIARLISESADELRFAIDNESGAALVLGLTEDRSLDTSSARWLAQRVAKVLSSVLDKARLLEASGGERKRVAHLEAQVAQAEKLANLGELAAGVVHELNNPLTAIVAYSSALQKRFEVSGAANDVESLRRITEAAERILKFSRDLVAYARPSSGIRSPVNLHDVVDQALLFCEHVLSQHDIHVEKHYDARAQIVQGVSGELTQIFVNLLTNACHASPSRSRIIISSRSDDHSIEIAVRDNGAGIDNAHIERVFEPFFTTKPAGNGTGLGLSIVRSIVERHGGRVSAESHERRGATFRVRLPLFG